MTAGRPARAVYGPLYGRRPALTHVAVVVPARDEEAELPRSLRALAAAGAQLRQERADLRLTVLVVLDSCTDGSASVVAGHPDLAVLTAAAGSVGAARAAGAEQVLADHRAAGEDPAALWLACTDADTAVPPHWLTLQVEAADEGVDALVGTVEPDEDMPDEVRRAWAQRHELREGHEHVHGANLGVRASCYLAAGGFEPVPQHEDVGLVNRLRALPGVCVHATDEHRVVTSSRRRGRTPGGFAGYVDALSRERPVRP